MPRAEEVRGVGLEKGEGEKKKTEEEEQVGEGEGRGRKTIKRGERKG